MAVLTGHATNLFTFKDTLITFLTTNASLVAASQQWTVLRDEETTPGTDERLYLRGPGFMGQDTCYLFMRFFNRPTLLGGQIFFYTGTGYSAGSSYYNQPGAPNSNTAVATGMTVNSNFEYIIIANGRRLIVAIRNPLATSVVYAGLFMPYASPSEYAYPFILYGGLISTADVSPPYSYIDGGLAFEVNSADWLRTATGTWVNSSSATWGTSHNGRRNADGFGTGESHDGSTFVVSPILVVETAASGDQAVLGQFDGLFSAAAFGLCGDDIVQQNSVDYLVLNAAGNIMQSCDNLVLRLQ